MAIALSGLKPSDFLTLVQQEMLITSKATSKIFCVIAAPHYREIHLSISNTQTIAIPGGFDLIELTKYSKADILIHSEAIKNLNKQHVIEFVCEEAFNRLTNREVIVEEEPLENNITPENSTEEGLEEIPVEGILEVTAESEPLNENNSSLEDMSIQELKTLLTEKGISFSHNSRKETLIKKLEEQK
jgi:hypothetical protein